MDNVIINNQAARLNITFEGSNGDLPDLVAYDANDGDIKAFATEAVRDGYVPGIAATPHANFTDFVVDRYAATAELPARIFLRPKTPFGR